MRSPRWYPSTVRLVDGSLLIAGGMIAGKQVSQRVNESPSRSSLLSPVGGYNNAPSTDNPTMEFFPPKGNGLPFYSSFLHDAVSGPSFLPISSW